MVLSVYDYVLRHVCTNVMFSRIHSLDSIMFTLYKCTHLKLHYNCFKWHLGRSMLWTILEVLARVNCYIFFMFNRKSKISLEWIFYFQIQVYTVMKVWKLEKNNPNKTQRTKHTLAYSSNVVANAKKHKNKSTSIEITIF